MVEPPRLLVGAPTEPETGKPIAKQISGGLKSLVLKEPLEWCRRRGLRRVIVVVATHEVWVLDEKLCQDEAGLRLPHFVGEEAVEVCEFRT